MAIRRWDPFGEVLSMQRELDRLFGRLGVGRQADETSPSVAWMPRIDVKASGEDMVVYAEVPGLKEEDIEIEVTDNVLSLRGSRKQETEKEEDSWLIRERSYGSFERALSLPEGVDQDKIEADYKEGILEIRIPRAAAALKPKKRRIAIGSGSGPGKKS